MYIRKAGGGLYEDTFRDQIYISSVNFFTSPDSQITHGETRQGRRASRVFRPTHSLFP